MDKLITLPNLQDYNTLLKKYIADKMNPTTEDLLSYGVEWDVTVSDPTLTRIGNPLLHKSLPVQSAYRGCIWSITEQKIMYYLDPNDWSKKEDGTPSKLDGTDGVIRIHIPRFYGKSEEDGNKRRVRISMSYIDDTWHVIPEMVVDANRPTLNADNAFVSVVNTTADYRGGNDNSANDSYLETDPFRTQLGKPRTALSRATARTYAQNANSQLMSYDIYKWIFYWNFVIEYATFNSQATYNAELTPEGYHQGGLGAGVTSVNWNYWTYYNSNCPLIPCGYCNEFGNGTGVKEAVITMPTASDGTGSQVYTLQVPRWRGFDNPFGDIWTNLDGILIDTPLSGAADTNVLPTCYIFDDPTKFTDSLDNIADADRTFSLPHNSGNIQTIYLGSDADIVPKTVGGSDLQYHCDYLWVDYDNTPDTLYVGGRAATGSHAGLGCFGCGYGVGDAAAYAGFRTLSIL